MSVEANKALLRRVLKAYGEGDMDPLFAAVDDDVAWTSNALAGHYRFGGPRRGRAGLIEALSMIAADYAIQRYDITEMVGEGEVIWSTCQVDVQDRRSDLKMSFPLAARWQFAGGKVCACQEFFDTASVLHQQGRLPDSVALAKSA